MTKDVLIHVTGYQRAVPAIEEEEHEAIEIITSGQYFYRGGKHYILYEEVEEGVSETTRNQIRFGEDLCLEVRKKGAVNARMVFEKGGVNEAFYETPYGQIPMDVVTENVRIAVGEERIEVGLIYQLEINHEPAADCTLTLEVTPGGTTPSF